MSFSDNIYANMKLIIVFFVESYFHSKEKTLKFIEFFKIFFR